MGDGKAILDWDELTAAERLRVTRGRRNKGRGEDEEEAARRHRVSRRVYRDWEAGYGRAPLIARGKYGAVTDREAFAVLRRRYRMSQEDLAAAVGRSRAWVNAVETGRAERVSADVLVAYWRRRLADDALDAAQVRARQSRLAGLTAGAAKIAAPRARSRRADSA